MAEEEEPKVYVKKGDEVGIAYRMKLTANNEEVEQSEEPHSLYKLDDKSMW